MILMCFTCDYSISHGLTFYFSHVKQLCLTVEPYIDNGEGDSEVEVEY